jgi:hypothetical protein
MKYTFFPILGVFLFLNSCTDPAPDANAIMQRAMEAHGVDQMAQSQLSFDFRGIDYSVSRDGGSFTYNRRFKNGTDAIHDQLDNSGFSRYRNDTLLNLPDSLTQRYRASLNSVIYFAQLPYSLDGDAVIKKFIKKDTVADKQYNEIEVTFNADGGGEDHEDVFLYWINDETHLIDYLAYSFCEEECGYRFRESVNRRTINGIIIQDYNNYKTDELDPELSQLDEMYENKNLTKVSTIELRKVKVD